MLLWLEEIYFYGWYHSVLNGSSSLKKSFKNEVFFFNDTLKSRKKCSVTTLRPGFACESPQQKFNNLHCRARSACLKHRDMLNLVKMFSQVQRFFFTCLRSSNPWTLAPLLWHNCALDNKGLLELLVRRRQKRLDGATNRQMCDLNNSENTSTLTESVCLYCGSSYHGNGEPH